MKRDLSAALDEALILLETGQATLEECLDGYPEQAVDLRPLLEIALELSGVPSPTSSPAALTAGRQRMLDALDEKKRRQTEASRPLLRHAGSLLARLVTRVGSAVSRTVPAYRPGLAVVLTLVLLVVAGVFLSSWLRPTVAQAATVGQVSGVVQVLPAGSDVWHPVSAGERVETGDRIRSGPRSTGTLAFFDGSATDLEANTEVFVAHMSFHRDGGAKEIVLQQTSGRTYSRVQPLPDPDARFEIETPSAVTAVHGTEFALTVETDGTTRVAVVEGVVNVTAQDTTVAVPAGQETAVQPEQPPDPSHPVLAAPTVTATVTPAPPPSTAPLRTKAGPPGQSKTVKPPGKTKTPKPPGKTKTPKPPGIIKTPEPPGIIKTPEPPGQIKKTQPSGVTKPPKPPKPPKDR